MSLFCARPCWTSRRRSFDPPKSSYHRQSQARQFGNANDYMERPVRAGCSYGNKRQNMHNPERMFIQRQDGLVDRVHLKLQLGGTKLKKRGKKVMRIQCRCKCQCQCVGVRSNDESAESV